MWGSSDRSVGPHACSFLLFIFLVYFPGVLGQAGSPDCIKLGILQFCSRRRTGQGPETNFFAAMPWNHTSHLPRPQSVLLRGKKGAANGPLYVFFFLKNVVCKPPQKNITTEKRFNIVKCHVHRIRYIWVI